jgi:26S proteasome regulatory subunit T6
MLREELQHLQEQCSYVGEVVKPMDKKKVLVKVHPEGTVIAKIFKQCSGCRLSVQDLE